MTPSTIRKVTSYEVSVITELCTTRFEFPTAKLAASAALLAARSATMSPEALTLATFKVGRYCTRVSWSNVLRTCHVEVARLVRHYSKD
jgi:hypothetical protein